MPGNFVHLGGAPEEIRSSKLGRKGLIAPDYWKWEEPTFEDYQKFFEGCDNAPTYEQVKFLCSLEHGGTHFGSEQGDTNHARFELLIEAINTGKLDSNNPFFIGYVHHLRLDKEFYSNPALFNQEAFDTDYIANSKKAMDNLHLDWDKTNRTIKEWYPEVVSALSDLPEKVQSIVKFAEGDPEYINYMLLKEFMEQLRKPRNIFDLLDDSLWIACKKNE